jgi:hypothetical protein
LRVNIYLFAYIKALNLLFNRRNTMAENKSNGKKPSPERLAALRNLPKDILDTLSHEEVNAFLHEDVWPNSLKDKLKDYIVTEQ